MEWAALIAWVVTAGGGFLLLAQWLRHGGMRQREGGQIRPILILSHFALAATGLVLWIVVRRERQRRARVDRVRSSSSSSRSSAARCSRSGTSVGRLNRGEARPRPTPACRPSSSFPVAIVTLHGIARRDDGRARLPRRDRRLADAISDQGEAGSREADAARDLRPARGGGRLPARPVLLGRAAGHRPRGRARVAPAHQRRHLAERARRARPLHAAARHGLQADARRARGRRGGGRRAPEGGLRAPVGDRPAVCVHRRRDRDHRLPLHAPLHRRGRACLIA